MRSPSVGIVVLVSVLLILGGYGLYLYQHEDYRRSHLAIAQAVAKSCGASEDWIKLGDRERGVSAGTVAISQVLECEADEQNALECIRRRLNERNIPYIDRTRQLSCWEFPAIH